MNNRKYKSKRSLKMAVIGVFLSIGLTACNAAETLPERVSEVEVESTIQVTDVRDYSFEKETSKVFLVKPNQEEHDITSFVESIDSGYFSLNADGMRFVFDLGERDITDEEKDTYEQELKKNQQISLDGKYLVLRNKEHTVIMKEGNRLYLFDDSVRMLDAPCICLENGTFSIPITDLVFAFGYQSYGVSTEGNDIFFSLIEK